MTDIFLFSGEANPQDIKLRDPTTSGGVTVITGTLAATDGADTAAFSGVVAHVGSLSATDGADGFIATGSVDSPAVADATDTHDGWLVAPVGKKSKRKKFDRLLEELMALYEELSAEAVEPVPMARPVVADYIKPARPTLAPMAVNPPPQIDWDALRRDMARLYMLIEQNRKAIEDQDEEEAEMLLMM